MRHGGYDDGYSACSCFWGSQPGSLVTLLSTILPSVQGLSVLDAGCGEGKNAIHLARMGANVHAIDISALAIANARSAWGNQAAVRWEIGDVQESVFASETFHVVIMYGLLHCLPSEDALLGTLRKLQLATRVGGFVLICTFNNRNQDLRAHPDLSPTLLDHSRFLDEFRTWD